MAVLIFREVDNLYEPQESTVIAVVLPNRTILAVDESNKSILTGYLDMFSKDLTGEDFFEAFATVVQQRIPSISAGLQEDDSKARELVREYDLS
mgnify:CR=1 FL=1|tara:strand:- start:930 stop:1211 length:282 start_codon:yes stop_codon:yes gene_type:complete